MRWVFNPSIDDEIIENLEDTIEPKNEPGAQTDKEIEPEDFLLPGQYLTDMQHRQIGAQRVCVIHTNQREASLDDEKDEKIDI